MTKFFKEKRKPNISNPHIVQATQLVTDTIYSTDGIDRHTKDVTVDNVLDGLEKDYGVTVILPNRVYLGN